MLTLPNETLKLTQNVLMVMHVLLSILFVFLYLAFQDLISPIPKRQTNKKKGKINISLLTEKFCLVCAHKENQFLAYGSDSNISSSVNRLLNDLVKGAVTV